MAPLSHFVAPGAPFPSPTPAGRAAALSLVRARGRRRANEASLSSLYTDLWRKVTPDNDLDGNATTPLYLHPSESLANLPGPTGMTVRDTTVMRDLRYWASLHLPPRTTLDAYWGPSTPDLLYVATSLDGERNLAAISVELKPAREDLSAMRSTWVTALAQESVYALEVFEIYGAHCGLVCIDTAISRLVVLSGGRDGGGENATERVLAIELDDDLVGTLPARVDLRTVLDAIQESETTRVGAIDLQTPNGDLDDTALGKIWAYWARAVGCLLAIDEGIHSGIQSDSPPWAPTAMEAVEVDVTGEHLLHGAAHPRSELTSTAAAMAFHEEDQAPGVGEQEDDDDDDDEWRPKSESRTASASRPIKRRRNSHSSTDSSLAPSAGRRTAVVNRLPERTVPHAARAAPSERRSGRDDAHNSDARVAHWLTAQVADPPLDTYVDRPPEAPHDPSPAIPGGQPPTPAHLETLPSRYLYPGRRPPSTPSAITSDGSLIAPDLWGDAVTGLGIIAVPMTTAQMDNLCERIHDLRPNSPPRTRPAHEDGTNPPLHRPNASTSPTAPKTNTPASSTVYWQRNASISHSSCRSCPPTPTKVRPAVAPSFVPL